ncbi:hypothetical protein ACKVMT_04705 [Halobacteriales archaeon Cl-PHB]
MLTLAEKVSALTAIAVLDVTLFAFGGVMVLLAAAMASMPLSVSIVHH